ncbi:THO complex subunit 4D-like [Alnus glutinosa]|uniref:THO complex subunit 4D-like n=1 Tax=Alnus glutinosa TaxID=3517 RepID=UPI002D791ED8|nr:THO complex subunit 4D-like [Alnus glutinosa]XP_062150776.1 THO complex subunit 4D-like [Alnus glutinosa]
MATALDMSLDDLIKNRGSRERGRGRGRARRGRGPGRASGGGRLPRAVHRGPLAVNTRPSSYTIAKSIRRTRSFPWQNDLFEESLRAAGISGIEIGTRLYVSNLDYGVTNEDIRELFSEIGELKRYAVHYDKNGRPTGSAEVVYTRRSDAFAALKRYNNVLLDGKPMRIEIVGANPGMPVSARVNVSGLNGTRKRTVVMTPGAGPSGGGFATGQQGSSRGRRGGMSGRARGRGRGRGGGGGRGGGVGVGRGGGRGRGRGREKNQAVEMSVDDLNLDLDNYHAEAKHP